MRPGSYVRTEEIREKHRKYIKEYLRTHKHPMQGRHHSQEVKDIISELNTGRISLTKGKKGLWKLSEETKEKMRKSSPHLSGKFHAMFGKHHSKETIEKYRKTRKGKDNAHWKGGRYEDGEGYIFIYQPNHPFATKNGYVREHRLVMESMIGRYLQPEEIPHHKGIKYPIDSIENKQDNRRENLQLFANESEHRKFHIANTT